MAPTPSDNRGVPAWVGPLIISSVAALFGWALGVTSSIGAKIDQQTVQLAEQKKILEMLCTFMDEKKLIDRQQDERLRQIELQLRSLSNR
jgi:hypothetical protein